jgi:TRAP-type C4-dicarboxylate transport system substrate-binding protein
MSASKSFKCMIAGALIGATLTASAAAQAETELLFNRFVPPKHPFDLGMFIPWAKDVAKATDGRVKVEFATAALAPPPKQWNMVSKGIADVAVTSAYPLMAFKLMPYVKYVTRIPGGLNANTCSLLLNKKKWDRLSQRDKDAIASVRY